MMSKQIRVIDSHTAGESTRVVVDGGPDLGPGTVAEKLKMFRNRYDHFRSGIVTEPRGWDVMVGALLCEPSQEDCDAGVIFFNNVGYLGMCGHGMIGVVQTLKYLKRLQPGRCRFETPAGVVTVEAHDDDSVSVENVESYRTESDVKVEVEGVGTVVGDIAWGGNWFFLAREPEQEIDWHRTPELLTIASQIRAAVRKAGNPNVDHVELFGQPDQPDADSRNFVLCPGGQFDRSPCGTGTSAKLACLAADGKLKPGKEWVQEGILGTSFTAHFEWSDHSHRRVTPTIRGKAFLTAESTLFHHDDDPFCWGVRTLADGDESA